MKKNMFVFFMLILCGLCGCTLDEGYIVDESSVNANNDVSRDVSTDVSISEKENVFDYEDIYDVYNILPYDDIFIATMKENKIDSYCESIYNKAVTTIDMRDAAYESYELWKTELEHAIEKISIDLNETQIDTLILNQKNWETNIQDTLVFEKHIFLDYSMYATELAYQFPLQRTRLYRERAIRIKYMHYMLEDQMDKNVSEYESLVFNYDK